MALKTKKVKLSQQVFLEVQYKKDGKEIATITIFKDNSSLQKIWIGWVKK